MLKNLRTLISDKKIRQENLSIIHEIAGHLGKDLIVVEAGAHIGTDTVQMSKIWPNGHIHAFEPVPFLYEELRNRTEPYRNITCYPLALGQGGGFDIMFVSSGASDGSSSLLAPKEHLDQHPEVLFEHQIRVQTISLDQWKLEYGIERVDFLWLDLQGAELSVLKASPETITQVQAIYTEVSLIEVYESVPLYPEVRNWLSTQGFSVVKEYLPWPDMGNVLFVRR